MYVINPVTEVYEIVEAYLRLNEVADADLRHDWDSHGRDDLLDHFWVALSNNEHLGYIEKRIAAHHPSDTTLGSNVCGNTFECHHSARL